MWALPFMAGSRDSLFSSHFLWCNSSEPKISWFICLFILWFCNRMVPWDTVSSHQGCPGKQPKQSNHHDPFCSACTGQPTPHRSGAQTGHICHCAHTTATSWVCVLGVPSRAGHNGKRGFEALLGLAHHKLKITGPSRESLFCFGSELSVILQ